MTPGETMEPPATEAHAEAPATRRLAGEVGWTGQEQEAPTVPTQEPPRDYVRLFIADELGSLTPQEWARLFAASRAGLVARMAGEGIEPERADQLVDAWDEEAQRRGLSRQSTGYWDQAPGWIREQARPK